MRARLAAVLVVLVGLVATAAACGGDGGGGTNPSQAPQTVDLAADAAIDYDAFRNALATVADGGTVKLAAGTYDLGDQQLTITKSVRLLGPGAEETEIVGSAGTAVVSVSGDASFSAEGVSFVKTGRTAGGALSVDAAELQLTRCRFTGSSHEGAISYASLHIAGNTAGTVRECVAADGDSGMDVAGQSAVSLESNTGNGNRFAGLSVYGAAQPLVRGNTFSKNGKAGIVVDDQAQPQVESNTCSRNVWGIWVASTGETTVSDNRLTDNAETGLVITGDATCKAVDNTCLKNKTGIAVWKTAHATLTSNTCRANKDTGIWLADRARVDVTRNTVDRNGTKATGGICVSENAVANVSVNTCQHNAAYGILFRDKAGGRAEKNYCAFNKYGIVVNDRAKPVLKGNRCEENSAKNVEIYRGG